MTVKRDGITFVDDVGGSGGATNVNVSEIGGTPVTDPLSVKIADGVDPSIKATVHSFAFVKPLTSVLVDPATGFFYDPFRVTFSGKAVINGISALFAGPVPGSDYPIDAVCGVVALFLTDSGSFSGVIRATGGPSGTIVLIDKVYNATDDTVVQELPFNKLLLVPVAGMGQFSLYLTTFNSGFFDFSIQGGPGSISFPRFKVPLVGASPTFATVGIASAQAVAANALRKGLILVNTSANRISLGIGAAAVLDSGITLYPQGAYNMGEYDFDLGAVNAIASGAGSNMAIQEYS